MNITDNDNLQFTVGFAMTKARKRETLKLIAEVVGERLVEIRNEEQRFTFSEIATFSNVHRSRVSELVNKNILSEKVLAGLISGGFVSSGWILKKLRGKLDEGQEKYVQTFAMYEMRELRYMIKDTIMRGGDPGKMFAKAYKEEFGEQALAKAVPSYKKFKL